jgi:hypothetical protein
VAEADAVSPEAAEATPLIAAPITANATSLRANKAAPAPDNATPQAEADAENPAAAEATPLIAFPAEADAETPAAAETMPLIAAPAEENATSRKAEEAAPAETEKVEQIGGGESVISRQLKVKAAGRVAKLSDENLSSSVKNWKLAVSDNHMFTKMGEQFARLSAKCENLHKKVDTLK